MKRRKSCCIDDIPIELLKELDNKNLCTLCDILNIWWTNESVPEEELKARIVLLFKSGASNDLSNYRPIALLTSFYKIFAACIGN